MWGTLPSTFKKVIFCTPFRKHTVIREDYTQNRADGMQFKEAYFKACYDNLKEGKLRLQAEMQLAKYGWPVDKTPLKFGMTQGNYSC